MVHPLLERELTAVMRGGFRMMSWRMLGLLLGITGIAWTVSRFVPGPGPFQFLLHFYLALAIGSVAYATAGAAQGLFSIESHRGTMNLVLLTCTRPWQLIAYKLASPLLTAALLLSLIVPFLLAAAPASPIPSATLIGCVAFIAALTLFQVAVAAWGSIERQQASGRSRFRMVFVACVYFGPMALFLFAPMIGISASWLGETVVLSPLWTGINAVIGLETIAPGSLFASAGFMAAGSCVAIARTGHALRRMARVVGTSADAPSIRSVSAQPSFKSERYPYTAVASTDATAVRIAGWSIAGIAFFWTGAGLFLGWDLFVRFGPYVALVQFAVLFWQTTVSMGRRIAADRHHGMLELLIVAGLEPRSIAVGLALGAVRQFDPVVRITAAIWSAIGIIGLFVLPRSPVVWILHLLLWGGFIAVLFMARRRPNYSVACHGLQHGNLEAAIVDASLRSALVSAGWFIAIGVQAGQFLWNSVFGPTEFDLVPAVLAVWIWFFRIRTRPARGAGHFVMLFEALVAQDHRPEPEDDGKTKTTSRG